MLLIYQQDKARYKHLMDITNVRLKNARRIAKDVGGQARLAEIMGKSESQMSQIIGRTPKRNIGQQLARQLEKAGGKPKFWLDVDHALNQVREPSSGYGAAVILTPTERRMLMMWRSWSPVVKQYVFGQLLIADFTKDVLRDMFEVRDEKTIDEVATKWISEDGKVIR